MNLRKGATLLGPSCGISSPTLIRGRRASLVDIALSPIGSQLVGTILPNVSLFSSFVQS